GEREAWDTDVAALDGSSPLAWGEGFGGAAPHSSERFIPTRVGRGTAAPCARCSAPVHPHSRGERCAVVGAWASPPGSSPLAWGEVPNAASRFARYRFIPTRVGRGTRRRRTRATTPVHPHSRGERTPLPPLVSREDGSSP